MAQTSYSDFALHITASVEQFRIAAPLWYQFAITLDGGDAAQQFSQHWLPDERAWIAAHRPDACLFAPFNYWNRAVTDIDWAVAPVTTGEGLHPNPDLPASWQPAYEAILAFDPQQGSACPAVVTFDLFVAHVRASIATFAPAADGLYYWVRYLDYGGSGPEALRGKWLPTETRWLNQHEPQACFEDSWRAWRGATDEVGAATLWMAPFGGTAPDEFTRFAAAREAIESFDPTALSTC